MGINKSIIPIAKAPRMAPNMPTSTLPTKNCDTQMTRALVKKPTNPRPNGVTSRPKMPSIIHPITAIASAKNKALQNPPTEKFGTIQLTNKITIAETMKRNTCRKKVTLLHLLVYGLKYLLGYVHSIFKMTVFYVLLCTFFTLPGTDLFYIIRAEGGKTFGTKNVGNFGI